MEKLYAYTMVSRNKDNKGVLGFKQRTKSYLCYESEESKMIEKFDRFVLDGVRGEKSRLYKSVNARNEEKTKNAFFARAMIENISVVKYHRAYLSRKISSCSCRNGNACGKQSREQMVV